MAITLNTNTNAGFFEKVLGPEHPTTLQTKALIAAGAVFEVGLYTIKATIEGKVYHKDLTVGTTSLMKGTVDFAQGQLNRNLIKTFITSLPIPDLITGEIPTPITPITQGDVKSVSVVAQGAKSTVNLIILIKAIRFVTGLLLKESKDIAENIIAGVNPVTVLSYVDPYTGKQAFNKLQSAGANVILQAHPLPPFVNTHSTPITTVKPVSSVIPLRDAQAIGQKVKGTSSGSVYHCVALNKRVRLAARIYAGTSISIRAEWQGATSAELKALQDIGMSMKENYASWHGNSGDIPIGKVIGAFVLGLGIVWDQVVMSSSQLVVG